jgi:hypothetical protein
VKENEMAPQNRHNGDSPEAEDLRGSTIAMMAGAQERLRAGVGKAAEVMPDAVAGAQVAARDTQRALDQMSDQGLLAGAAFSLGLGVGLLVSGTNRLLVFLVLAPAAAMLATLMGRETGPATALATTRRRGTRAATKADE